MARKIQAAMFHPLKLASFPILPIVSVNVKNDMISWFKELHTLKEVLFSQLTKPRFP